MEQSKLFTEEHIKSVFRMLDQDNNGFVERGELLALMQSRICVMQLMEVVYSTGGMLMRSWRPVIKMAMGSSTTTSSRTVCSTEVIIMDAI